MKMYILEVQQHQNYDLEVVRALNGRYEHIGYVNKIFNTKREASNYYDSFNPHLRSLNAHGNWCSDWDPNSYLRCIVRKYFGECLKLAPFES